jgi:hypothetical protein
MLVPLKRSAFEQVIPLIATGPQYLHYWGKSADFLRRLLISIVALTTVWLLGKLLGEGAQTIKLIIDIIAGLYWLWAPIYWASIRNARYRRYPYCGFWRGKVLSVFITEEVIRKEETVNEWGELVIVENCERKVNVEVGDRSGFKTTAQAPIQRIYKAIAPGQVAELIIFSRQGDLSRIDQMSDLYLPTQGFWIGEYPILRRDIFKSIRQEIR